MKVKVRIMLMDRIGYFSFIKIFLKVVILIFDLMCRMNIDISVERKIVVLVVEIGLNLNIVVIGVVLVVIGVFLIISWLRCGMVKLNIS